MRQKLNFQQHSSNLPLYQKGVHFLGIKVFISLPHNLKKATNNIVPCWCYLLGITDSAMQSFTLSLFPTSMVGITIALPQPVLTLTALTMALPCRFSDCKLKNCRTLAAFPLWSQLITS
jgi:hypothetical protein